MKSEKNAQLVAGLRELAEFIETNDDFEFVSGDSCPIEFSWRDWYLHDMSTEEKRAEIAKIARKLGNAEKIYSDDFFWLEKQFGPMVIFRVHSMRQTVCERVVTGTITLPAVPAQPERTIEKVEWRCSPILEESHV